MFIASYYQRIYYKSPYMSRKIGTSGTAKSRVAKKPAGKKTRSKKPKKSRTSAATKTSSRKLASRRKPARRRSKPAGNPALAMIRPPPPGMGKRGEQGYFAYLLPQAHAAHRAGHGAALARHDRIGVSASLRQILFL